MAACPGNRETFVVEQAAYFQHKIDVFLPVQPVPTLTFHRLEHGKLAFPIAQDERLHVRDPAHVTDAIEAVFFVFRYRYWRSAAHSGCNALNSQTAGLFVLKPAPSLLKFSRMNLLHPESACKSAGAACKLISMPELPDIAAYITALEARIVAQPIERVRLASPFLLRTVEPPLSDVEGRMVGELRRIGKRIAIGLEGDLWLVLHLMIAGRLHWRPRETKLGGRRNLAAFDFPNGSLVLSEAATKQRASLHVVSGEDALHSFDPGGIEIFTCDLSSFREALTTENRTLKRALTDPRMVSGIGNAYSDEILHAAELSPLTLTHKLKPEEWNRLFTATRQTLKLWVDRLRTEAEAVFPEKVTAFRKDMAAHGRFGLPCPRCGEKIQRIRYADKETNYCARCQTGGKVLADRGLSRLLGADWPRTLEELEALKRR